MKFASSSSVVMSSGRGAPCGSCCGASAPLGCTSWNSASNRREEACLAFLARLRISSLAAASALYCSESGLKRGFLCALRRRSSSRMSSLSSETSCTSISASHASIAAVSAAVPPGKSLVLAMDSTMAPTISSAAPPAAACTPYRAQATATTAGGWFSTASVTIALHARCFATRSASSRTSALPPPPPAASSAALMARKGVNTTSSKRSASSTTSSCLSTTVMAFSSFRPLPNSDALTWFSSTLHAR
mmetsp:Transcript_15535/g.48305  ORF Transcript_15535/g.48305 Transcript_15535/m.48305 type:complete len:247 (+) Transcript_15535:78-818(+)